jgi:hypothetical protein
MEMGSRSWNDRVGVDLHKIHQVNNVASLNCSNAIHLCAMFYTRGA